MRMAKDDPIEALRARFRQDGAVAEWSALERDLAREAQRR
jgi:hypothetical protein